MTSALMRRRCRGVRGVHNPTPHSWFFHQSRMETDVKMPLAVAIFLLSPAPAASPHAQPAQPLRDPTLPSVQPQALQQLSDDRIRQKIMQESQAHYGGRCVCAYETHDARGRSCKGRHEVIKTDPQPVCYPRQVTDEMVNDWRLKHP